MILTLNAGSSSLKYALYAVDEAGQLTAAGEGLRERIAPGAHEAAFAEVVAELEARGALAGVRAVAHRVVHGGQRFRAPTRIDAAVEEAIEALAPLAPLHNPANLLGIRLARTALPGVPHVAVFDTAFHATLPEVAYRYPVPAAWFRDLGVRKYGFHGTSHAYVSGAARRVLAEAGRAHRRLVTLHLGNGCSAAAVLDGACVDTTMGLTPLAGLMMGTRPGDLDPGLAPYLAARGVPLAEQDRQLNRESGLLAVAGANDMRELLRRRADGDEAARLAVEMFVYRLRKTVGAYAAVLGGLDALAFTAGIGENSDVIRAEVCAGLASFGVDLDPALNRRRGDGARVVSTGRVAVLVVPTDEERAMATAAAEFVR